MSNDETKPDDLAGELAREEYEPLLPIEKKLIGYSLALGIVLLGLLMWVSAVWFPAGK